LAVHIHWDEPHQIATLALSGTVDYPEVRAGILELSRRVGAAKDLRILIDWRETGYVPNSVEAIELADVVAQPGHLLERQVAFVAEQEPQIRVVSVVAALCSLRGGEMRSFRDYGSASRWLGRDGAGSFTATARRSSRPSG
jgi:hypothetical protein